MLILKKFLIIEKNLGSLKNFWNFILWIFLVFAIEKERKILIHHLRAPIRLVNLQVDQNLTNRGCNDGNLYNLQAQKKHHSHHRA